MERTGSMAAALPIIIPAIFGSIGIVSDIREQKIKNMTTYPLFIAGFLWQLHNNQFYGLVETIALSAIVLTVVSVVPFLRLKGGDAKLLMGLSLFAGLSNLLTLLVATAALITLYNLALYAKDHGAKSLLRSFVVEVTTQGQVKHESKRLAGAPFIAAAYVLTVVLAYR